MIKVPLSGGGAVALREKAGVGFFAMLYNTPLPLSRGELKRCSVPFFKECNKI